MCLEWCWTFRVGVRPDEPSFSSGAWTDLILRSILRLAQLKWKLMIWILRSLVHFVMCVSLWILLQLECGTLGNLLWSMLPFCISQSRVFERRCRIARRKKPLLLYSLSVLQNKPGAGTWVKASARNRAWSSKPVAGALMSSLPVWPDQGGNFSRLLTCLWYSEF